MSVVCAVLVAQYQRRFVNKGRKEESPIFRFIPNKCGDATLQQSCSPRTVVGRKRFCLFFYRRVILPPPIAVRQTEPDFYSARRALRLGRVRFFAVFFSGVRFEKRFASTFENGPRRFRRTGTCQSTAKDENSNKYCDREFTNRELK